MADYSVAKMTQAVKDKGLKYAAVSVFNVLLGQGLLLVFVEVLAWDRLVSNLLSAAISAGPAYVVSRKWVWNKSGKNSLFTEVLPFWGFALLGLALSSVLVAATANIEFRLMANAASLAGYGVIWVVKFFFLDALIFKVVAEHDLVDDDSADPLHTGTPEVH